MTPLLPPDALDRLVRLCGMLGSDFDGERANAARMADQLLRAHGLTWRELLHPALPQPQPDTDEAEPDRSTVAPDDWRSMACAVIVAQAATAWEREFAGGCFRRLNVGDGLSRRQREMLRRIFDERCAP